MGFGAEAKGFEFSGVKDLGFGAEGLNSGPRLTSDKPLFCVT